jgi:hypothetical protein
MFHAVSILQAIWYRQVMDEVAMSRDIWRILAYRVGAPHSDADQQ